MKKVIIVVVSILASMGLCLGIKKLINHHNGL